MVSDKGPGLQLCRKEFPQRGKVVKQVKCLLGEKKSTVHVDRHMGRLREKIPVLCPCGSLNHLYGAFLPVFLCLIIMIGLVQFHIWFFQDPSMCADASLSQDGSYQKTSGQNIPWHDFSLDSKDPFLCMFEEGILTSRMRNKWSVQSPASCLSSYSYLGIVVNREWPNLPPASGTLEEYRNPVIYKAKILNKCVCVYL